MAMWKSSTSAPTRANQDSRQIARRPQFYPQDDRASAAGAHSSIRFQNLFAAVRGVADHTLAPRIDDEVEAFQRQLTNKYRNTIGNFQDIENAIASLNRQPYAA